MRSVEQRAGGTGFRPNRATMLFALSLACAAFWSLVVAGKIVDPTRARAAALGALPTPAITEIGLRGAVFAEALIAASCVVAWSSLGVHVAGAGLAACLAVGRALTIDSAGPEGLPCGCGLDQWLGAGLSPWWTGITGVSLHGVTIRVLTRFSGDLRKGEAGIENANYRE